jgi:type I restriction enzyme M protein
MLDVETKNRINTARDILVGKVPDPKSQVEQITIALIYKFMDDMDVESEELGGKRTFFVGEYAKYAWRKIFDPRQSGYDLLNLYSEAIGKMDVNPGVPKLFRDIFKNAYLPYRDPETLKSFLKIINEFDYSHSENLGDAFEFLLSILSSQGDAGQFRTPRHIIDFMVEIIDPKKHEIILDPACGTAGFLISSYKHIVKQNSSNYLPDQNDVSAVSGTQSVNEVIITSNGYSGDKLTAEERKILADNIHGYDISPDMVRLSLVNMYLHGIKEPHISEYDTLTSEDHWNQYCDVILANPPFMSPKGGIRPHKRFSVQSNRSEVLFVDYIAEHLTPDGRAIVIVPEGVIFQSGTAYKNLRKMLVEKYLVGVISLPAGVFNPYSGVKTSILWLDKVLTKKTDKILFAKIENDGFDLGAQRRAIKENDLPAKLLAISNYKNQLSSKVVDDFEWEKGISLISREKISGSSDYNLSGDRYKITTKNLSEYKKVALDEYIDFVSGLTLSIPDCQDEEGTPIISMNSILEHGILVKEGIRKIRIPEKSRINYLKKGDLLFNWRNGSKHLVGKTAYFDWEGKYTFASFLLGIRVKPDFINSKYLWNILNYCRAKGKFMDFMRQNVNGLFNREELKQFQIPLPPLSIQEDVVAEVETYQKIINGARMVVENYKPRIDIDPNWEMVKLGEVCETSSGGTPLKNKAEYFGGNIPWLKSGEVAQGFITSVEETITELGLKNSSAKLFPKDTVLVAMYGATAGKVGLLRIESTTNQAVCGILPNDRFIPEFLYYYLLSQTDYLISQSTGGAQPNISQAIIRKLKIPLPPIETQQQIVDTILQEQSYINSTKHLTKMFEQKIRDRIAKVWGE